MTRQVPSRSRLRARGIWLHAMAAACALAVLTGCTGQIADMGDSTGSTARAAPSYPAVHDGPAVRDTRLLSPEERERILDELAATRQRQEAATAEAPPAPQRPAR